MSPDTIVPNTAHPQSYNRYAYALNNPLKYVDPTGHRRVSDGDDYYDVDEKQAIIGEIIIRDANPAQPMLLQIYEAFQNDLPSNENGTLAPNDDIYGTNQPSDESKWEPKTADDWYVEYIHLTGFCRYSLGTCNGRISWFTGDSLRFGGRCSHWHFGRCALLDRCGSNWIYYLCTRFSFFKDLKRDLALIFK